MTSVHVFARQGAAQCQDALGVVVALDLLAELGLVVHVPFFKGQSDEQALSFASLPPLAQLTGQEQLEVVP